MRIAFNTSPLNGGHKTRGIGFYTQNLLEHLRAVPEIEVLEFSNLSEVYRVDLVHYPFFDLFTPTLPLQKRFPTVVTIHDIIPLLFPQFYPPGLKGTLFNFIQKTSLQGVNGIITDSLSSKKDIVNYLGITDDKIYPVSLACRETFKPIANKKFLETIRKKYELPEVFALYIGNINWNKNLLNMALACQKAKINLVLVGSAFEKVEDLNHPELASYREFLRLFAHDPRIFKRGFVDQEDLVGVLNLSQALLLPSFYEGFGLPILEAQACGVPVITSNISSMPEVAGQGALLVDPYNLEKIKDALKVIIERMDIRKQLIQKGFENVKKFSWEQTARQTVAVYEKVIQGEVDG